MGPGRSGALDRSLRHTVGVRGDPIALGCRGSCGHHPGVGLAGNGTVLIPGLLHAATGVPINYPGTETPMTWISHLPAVPLLLWGRSSWRRFLPSTTAPERGADHAIRHDCAPIRPTDEPTGPAKTPNPGNGDWHLTR